MENEKRIRLITPIKKYKISFLQYTATGSVMSNCADITFFNNGANNVTLNSAIILYTGQSISFSANSDEIDTTTYYFSFQDTGKDNNLVVFRKEFV